MRVLIITKIFPNRHNQSYAAYNRHQFRELSKLCDVTLLAVQPSYPGARFIDLLRGVQRAPDPPVSDVLDGMHVEHPRVFYLPKASIASGATYALSLVPSILAMKERVDVVMGSFAFPDGWAAVALAKAMGLPSVVKLHGSDINVVSEARMLRSGLRFALGGAQRVVANNRKILDKAIGLGAKPDGVRLISNGIEKDLFFPRPQREAREALGLPVNGKRILFVGRTSAAKGVWELLEAMEQVVKQHPDVHLDLVGPDTSKGALQAQAEKLGLPATFHGEQVPASVAQYAAAADLVTLPSHAEGMPNSLAEALACGRPVVATNVGGIPMLVTHSCQGELVPPKDAPALAAALARVLSANYDPAEISRSCTLPSWEGSAAALHEAILEAQREFRQ